MENDRCKIGVFYIPAGESILDIWIKWCRSENRDSPRNASIEGFPIHLSFDLRNVGYYIRSNIPGSETQN